MAKTPFSAILSNKGYYIIYKSCFSYWNSKKLQSRYKKATFGHFVVRFNKFNLLTV